MNFGIAIKFDNNLKNLEKTLDSIIKQNGVNFKNVDLYIVHNKKYNFNLEKIKDYIKHFNNTNLICSFDFASPKCYKEILKNTKIEYMIFIDENKYLDENSISNLFLEIEKNHIDYGIWEMRLFPIEYAKDYDPLTCEIKYFNNGCFCVNRKVLELFYKFDKRLKYIEKNVDFSIKLLEKNIKIKYLVNSMYYEITPVDKDLKYYYDNYIEYENNYYLRCKYGSLFDLVKWLKYCFDFVILTKTRPYFPRKRVLILKMIKSIFVGIIFKVEGILFHRIKYKFYKYGYDIMRHNNTFADSKEIKKQPLVSILVRTCGRPNVLRETLISIRNQTYKNIEVVIVEDGKNISENMIKSEFKDMNINYTYTGKKVGRCVAGNIAMERANGIYLNFLDDDDLFYRDHVETLVSVLENNKDYRIAHSFAFQTNIVVNSVNPEYKYDVIHKMLVYNKKFNRLRLWIVNFFPIQSIMFKKDVFVENGGFDLELDSMEDWELWARFGKYNDFLPVEKVTSLYRIICTEDINKARQKMMEKYTPIAEEKIQSQTINGVSIKSIVKNYRDIVEFNDDAFKF